MDQETARLAKQFAKAVKRKYAPSIILLFGSRARGDNLKKSDFDFLIVSEKFSKQPFIFRASKLYDDWDSPYDIEPLCYTPQEFERKKNQRGIVREAIKEGIEF